MNPNRVGHLFSHLTLQEVPSPPFFGPKKKASLYQWKFSVMLLILEKGTIMAISDIEIELS
jgi:hypothetical protein